MTPPPASFEQFSDKIEQEFCLGSAIRHELYRKATKIVSDTEQLPGGDAEYPLHEALNWHLTRFGHQARANLYAALLLNEDGSCWQAKLSTPLQDLKKGKERKYETPTGNGSRAYLPPVPSEIRQLIGERYGVEVPLNGSFWSWVEGHPEIPMVLTEGGKKGLALLSQGYVPLALYGVYGGYRKLPGDARELVPDVIRFAKSGRPFIVGFDQDEKAATRRRVTVALYRTSALLLQAGCQVSIAAWDPKHKGLDDLIAHCGATAWDAVRAEALRFENWQILQRLERRLTLPAAVKVTTAHLSTLELSNLPERVILAVDSAKGTEKTKLIGRLVAGVDKVVGLAHRIALGRNQSLRLELDYISDLDKANGQFIKGSAYSFRVGLCIDSLLAIDPNRFAGCDLVIDEVVQVLRHLLTSSTCAKDGKRPALLARLRELIRVARRVIVADADVDNATLAYLKELRGDDEPVVLIRNTYQPRGYPARFIKAPDRSEIIGEALAAVKALEPGKTLFIATDSRGISKLIARLIAKECPGKRVLLINSETSGGEAEREFIQTPDPVLERHTYDVVVCSPSVATGVSVEAQGIISQVFGIFIGCSCIDADMSQALGRVREPVPRVVWCAQRGSNLSQVSRSVSPLEVRSHLQQKTTTTVSLLRCSLREDIAGDLGSYDWQSNPHLDLYCRIVAAQNFSMYRLQNALLERLKFEGNQITIEDRTTNPMMKLLIAIARQEQREMEAEALVAAEDLSYLEVQALEQKEGTTPEESLAIAKFHLKEFYCIDTLTVDDVMWDNQGRRRGELLNLEAQLFPGIAIDRTVKALEKQVAWNQGYCPWDISHAELRRAIRFEIGVNELIAKMRDGWGWCKYDLKPYADRARELAQPIKAALHFTISEGMSDTQIVHQLLSQLGIKIAKPRWSRKLEKYEGEKLRTYSLDFDHWQKLIEILHRRAERRERLVKQSSEFGSPIPSNQDNQKRVGDPNQVPFSSDNRSQSQEQGPDGLNPFEEWLRPESLADIRSWLAAADTPEALAEIRRMVPDQVWEVIAS